jgi:hypothetical protein
MAASVWAEGLLDAEHEVVWSLQPDDGEDSVEEEEDLDDEEDWAEEEEEDLDDEEDWAEEEDDRRPKRRSDDDWN